MRKQTFLPFLIITVALVFTSCKTKNSDDVLAEQIAKSENFNAIMNYGKKMEGTVKVMPDSTMKKLKALKPRVDYLLSKNNKLSPAQVRDSFIKITNITKSEGIFNSAFLKQSEEMGVVYKRFFSEFPTFKNLPKEEKKIVFRKATAIWLKNLKKARVIKHVYIQGQLQK